MKMQDLRDGLIGLAIFCVMALLAFWLGRCTGQMDAENEQTVRTDTVTRVDTVTILDPQPHLVTQEIVKYKYVPITTRPDTVIKRDTIIEVKDGVAVIPITMKTYTDSSSYKAVVSGYDPRLEQIEVYQQVTVITHQKKAPRWSVGLQGGMYMTTEGLRPGIGIGINYDLSNIFVKNK